MFGSIYNLVFGDLTPEQRTAVWRVLITFVIAGQILVAYGWVPAMGAGFASKDAVLALEQSVYTIRVNQLLEAIEQERKNVCIHVREGNDSARVYAVKKREELLREYKNLTGSEAEQVTCRELGVKGAVADGED